MAEQTLEQKAEEANRQFAESFRGQIESWGYSFHSYVSNIRSEEMKAGRYLPEKEGNKPCIVADLTSAYTKPLMRMETVRAFFKIFNEYKGIKVYIEGDDIRKKKTHLLSEWISAQANKAKS